MKKLMLSLVVLAFAAFPGKVFAADNETVCTQNYGGGVVCAAHAPVNTGIADNIPLIGSIFLGSSGFFFYFAKKADKNRANQNN